MHRGCKSEMRKTEIKTDTVVFTVIKRIKWVTKLNL
jgi:hypothetical protein